MPAEKNQWLTTFEVEMCGQSVNNRDKGVTGLVSASLTNVGRASAGAAGVGYLTAKRPPKEPLLKVGSLAS